MGRRVEEEDNHWPGFVDALSTIVMVVTFLLIVLGIVIFGISQQIAKTVLKAEVTGRPESEQVDKDVVEVDTPNVAEVKPDATPTPQQATTTSAEVGVKDPNKSEQTTQTELVEADNQLQIQSRKVIDEKQIVVATQEQTDKPTPDEVIVTSAAQFLTLTFQGQGVEMTPIASTETSEFLDQNKETLAGETLTVWGFFNPGASALSQAKRRAYFRVLSVRNVLMNAGHESENITINVRPATGDEEIDQVRVFMN